MNEPSFVTVVGTSAGGLSAIGELVAQFPRNLDSAVFIVLHLSKTGFGDILCRRIERYTDLPCRVAKDGDPIEKGVIYVAPADYHLVVKEGSMRVVAGAVENRWRPSIDVLFRSAAVAYAERTIGIILTGLLDDGTSGMLAIKKCGGTCIVQDPNEAEYPDMPLSVINNMEVDYCVALQHMGFIVQDVISNKEPRKIQIPEHVRAEAGIAERTATGIDVASPLGTNSVYSCPDCGGNLWEIQENGFDRFRCHVGHAFSQSDLLKRQSEQLEATFWVALRMMEERRNLLNKIGNEEAGKGLNIMATSHLERARELEGHIGQMKKLLFESKTD